jgi:glycerol-3-phosphate acyltransferase PlsY
MSIITELASPITLLILSFGYLCGSIPFGLVLTRVFAGTDIRTVGSGNIGATNVLRTGNRVLAFATLLLDAGKGAAAIYLVMVATSHELAGLAGAGAVLGHCFPVWLRFAGGKGVATSMAVIAAVSWQAGILMALSWLLVARISGYSSLAALLGFVVASLFAMTLPTLTTGIIIFVGIVSWGRHHENIRRLLAGTESKISLSRSKS